MNLHRRLQIHNLQDNASALARQYRRAAANLAGIRNFKGCYHYLYRASKAERVAFKAARRLA